MKADRNHDQSGRPWGVTLWAGGPVLGGANHREFVANSIATERARQQVLSEPVIIGGDAPESTRRAALRYILQAFGHDLQPINAVNAILAGERPDLVRRLLDRRPAPPVQNLDAEWEVPA